MTEIYLGLGSNKNAPLYISRALDALHQHFGELRISPVYESEPVGCKGSNFLNLVVHAHTDLSVKELLQTLREIEYQNGRNRTAPRFSSRTLDIDILLYGNRVGEVDAVVLPRPEILENAFVLLPLQDIAPNLLHPQLQQNVRTIWAAYDKNKQRLWRVDFEWHGKRISVATTH